MTFFLISHLKVEKKTAKRQKQDFFATGEFSQDPITFTFKTHVCSDGFSWIRIDLRDAAR